MEPLKSAKPALLALGSASFGNGRRIPIKHSKDGGNVSPALEWSDLPIGTLTLALLCEDPDAPQDEPWVHWVIYNIPELHPGLPEGVSGSEQPEEVAGAVQGINSFGKIGYDGPRPPAGHGTHHYRFILYAVDSILELGPRASKGDLLSALKGHVLASAQRVGTYSR